MNTIEWIPTYVPRINSRQAVLSLFRALSILGRGYEIGPCQNICYRFIRYVSCGEVSLPYMLREVWSSQRCWCRSKSSGTWRRVVSYAVTNTSKDIQSQHEGTTVPCTSRHSVTSQNTWTFILDNSRLWWYSLKLLWSDKLAGQSDSCPGCQTVKSVTTSIEQSERRY